jgi:hypothetical protein
MVEITSDCRFAWLRRWGCGKALEGAFAFPQNQLPVASYDGTMLRSEINRQCTPDQLLVKRKSTS